ncbi:hypothetical protein SAMN04515647_1390 [Cohaesibacter sp. ES.047]|uniref:hypothetical protein n=1 Tax=Cohaesibacter sp. ES.047 TaxID=1798205 RepID=UPI000BB8C1AC|nr:hypothetical protein [Cohaesibacter sp. ES.047]SNY91177.1 hypothetical protein SAMN04515647_1390 [Cohaesibacter sp. ES.047]
MKKIIEALRSKQTPVTLCLWEEEGGAIEKPHQRETGTVARPLDGSEESTPMRPKANILQKSNKERAFFSVESSWA